MCHTYPKQFFQDQYHESSVESNDRPCGFQHNEEENSIDCEDIDITHSENLNVDSQNCKTQQDVNESEKDIDEDVQENIGQSGGEESGFRNDEDNDKHTNKSNIPANNSEENETNTENSKEENDKSDDIVTNNDNSESNQESENNNESKVEIREWYFLYPMPWIRKFVPSYARIRRRIELKTTTTLSINKKTVCWEIER